MIFKLTQRSFIIVCLLKIEMSSCLRGKAHETQHEHVLFVMGLVWQLYPWPAEALGDWTSPFCVPVSFSGNHLKDFIWCWAHLENHNLPVPCTSLLLIFSFFLQVPNCSFQDKKRCFTPVKAATSQHLSYQSEDETTHKHPAMRMGGKTVAPFPSQRPPKGQATQSDLPPQLILAFSKASGMLVLSY